MTSIIVKSKMKIVRGCALRIITEDKFEKTAYFNWKDHC